MPSQMDFQEFQFPDARDSRRKVDCTADVLVHREEDSLQSKSVCDLRKSLAWDSAFFNSPGVLDPEELFETLNFQVSDNGVDITGHREPMSLCSECIEPARTSGISSMRKSLAWDSAFFTSPGVLDAEELSVINRGFKGPEMVMLPGIEEGIWRSAESNSTINGDEYSLASLEIDLFDDIRASILNSHDASSNGASSTHKLRRSIGRQTGHSGMLDASSQARPVSLSGGSNPLTSRKPPKISGRATPSPKLPIKRASLSASHVKMDNKATKSGDGKNISMSKKMCVRESCNIISSSRPSGKSPSSALPAATERLARFCYSPAECIGKSPSNALRRTADSSLASSGLRSRTPLKYSAGSKSELMNSSDSIRLLATSKSTIYKSPASSIDGWSSESSSSSSSMKQRSNNSAASPINTPFREIFDRSSEVSNYERHQPSLGHESWETKFMNSQNSYTSMFTSPAPANVSRKLRPSGLRMPSPKKGYFDAENSTSSVQDGALKFPSGGQSISCKIGSGASKANISANRARYGKHRSTGTSSGSVSKSNLMERKQPLKEQRDVRMHRLGECNKENIVGFENQVDDLSQRMGAIDFSRDLPTGSKGN